MSKTCPACGTPLPKYADYCNEECKHKHLESIAKQRARAGNVMRHTQFSESMQAILDIMKERDVQYPEAVSIYESEKEKHEKSKRTEA